MKTTLSSTALLLLLGLGSPAWADHSTYTGRVPFQTLAQGRDAYGVNAGDYAFQTRAQWEAADQDLRRLLPAGTAIDWNREALVLAVRKGKPFGDVRVTAIEREALAQIMIFPPPPGPRFGLVVSLREPQVPGSVSGPTVFPGTAPYHLVKLRKHARREPVRFSVLRRFASASLASRFGASVSTVTVTPLSDGPVLVLVERDGLVPVSGQATAAETDRLEQAIVAARLSSVPARIPSDHVHVIGHGFDLAVGTHSSALGPTTTRTVSGEEDGLGSYSSRLAPVLQALLAIRDRIDPQPAILPLPAPAGLAGSLNGGN